MPRCVGLLKSVAVHRILDLAEMPGAITAQPNETVVEEIGHIRPILRIEPSRGWASLRLQELWHYRELLFFLAWRDVKVRYKQTGLGVAWAVLQPLLGMLVFTIFFGRLAKVPSDGIPYPLFSYSALLAWQLFAYSISESTNSVVGNERLITKVYFPRLVIPIASILAGLVDLAIAFVLVIAMMAYYGVHPGWEILSLPLFVVFELATALGVGLWLCARRDVCRVVDRGDGPAAKRPVLLPPDGEEFCRRGVDHERYCYPVRGNWQAVPHWRAREL